MFNSIKEKLDEWIMFHPMKFITGVVVLTFLLLLCVPKAFADRVDNMATLTLEERCGITSTIVYAGILTRDSGVTVQEEIDWAEAESIKENPDFRPFNENERAWLTKYYELGASMADEFKEINGRWPTKVEAYTKTTELNEQCINNAGEIHDGGVKTHFIKAVDEVQVPRDRIDRIREQPLIKYCEYTAVLYATGIKARNDGRPLLFKSVTMEEIEHARAVPDDAIYMIGMDTFTTREKMFVLKHVTAGWEYADARYAAGDEPYKMGDPFMQGAAEYMVECLNNEVDQRVESN